MAGPSGVASRSVPQTTQAQRSEVHRKLGKCLLRVQQYEMLVKAILVDHDQSGTLSNWQARRDKRIEEFAGKSLGQLIDALHNSVFKTRDDGEPSRYSKAPHNLSEGWFSFRTSLEMDPQGYEGTVTAMRELVALRNDFVHHLMQRFDLWAIDGCQAADAYLEQSYYTVDRHMAQLLDWARSIDHARQAGAQAVASIDPAQFVKPAPGERPALNRGSIIAERLREAEAFLAADGWTLLDDAIAFIGRIDALETPSRYGCRHWHQVLRGCDSFEMQKVALPERKGLFTVFRSIGQRSTAIDASEPGEFA